MATLDDDSNAETSTYLHQTETAPLLTSAKSEDELPQSPLSNPSMQEIIKKLFTRKQFICWFIFKILFFSQVFAAGLFVPLYAAEWFGGCLDSDGFTADDDCTPDYSTYAYYSTMFISIAGLITFLISSFIGHLTDTFGRKIFFFIAVVTWMIPRCIMVFYVDFYLYFALSLFEAINGGDFFIASKGFCPTYTTHKVNS